MVDVAAKIRNRPTMAGMRWREARSVSLQLMELPLVSVIIATRNRARVLQRCLNEYAKQTYPRVEIVVVDNGSTDETWSMLSQRDDVTAVRLDKNEKAQALNIAIDRAQGTYCWRTDDDAYPASPDTIADAVEHLEAHPTAAVVSGLAINIYEGNSIVGECARAGELTSPDGHLEHSSFMGCTTLLRRQAVLDAGGFWHDFYNEEQDLSLRLLSKGWKIHWKPKLVTHHLAEFSSATKDMVDARWQLRVTTRARLLATYFPRISALVRICAELSIECSAALYKRVRGGVILSTIAASFGEWRRASGDRRWVLAPGVRRFVLQRTLGVNETLRYYFFRGRAAAKVRLSK